MVAMETNTAFLSIDEGNLTSAFENAGKTLDGEREQFGVDLSCVRRIDSAGLNAIQDFAHRADEKKVKVVLRGVNANVYKMLKLARLTRHFLFAN
jgi:anti-anti-sigma regulatory factor